MVSTPEIFTGNSPMSPGPSVTNSNPSVGKSLCIFTEVLAFKKKNAIHQVGDSESKHKEIISGSVLCSSIPNKKRHTKSMNGLINIFIFGFCNILRLCSLQFPNIALKFLFVVILNHSWFQFFY